MELPQDFKERMQIQLGDACKDFLACYEKERVCGLRCNQLKIERDRLEALLRSCGMETEPVPWAKEGLYYPACAQPGKLPLHEAGAYYIQEPSAMTAVELLNPRPGDRVLDLCAAPGGKSTQIAGRLHGEGLLVSNEIMPSRAKILSGNIERLGVWNAVVLNETPERLAGRFAEFFDRILVDAPCSGEGMFRKNADACGEWSLEQTKVCAKRQRSILEQAAVMLKPGGTLVYSTCTFAPQENEEMADWLVQEHPQFVLEGTEQIWPHLARGEGHFAARFRKEQDAAVKLCRDKIEYMQPSGSMERHAGLSGSGKGYIQPSGSGKGHMQPSGSRRGHAGLSGSRKGHARPAGNSCRMLAGEDMRLVSAFFQETLSQQMAARMEEYMHAGRLIVFGNHIYLIPSGIESLDGLKTERAGLQIGSIKKNRFEPAHALAMALHPQDTVQILEPEDPQRYLYGETIRCGGQKGWTLVVTDGCSIGWGKASCGVLKNHYPKGLRTMQ